MYYYGYPYTTDYPVRYAMKHHFQIDVNDRDREYFGLPPVEEAPDAKLDYANLTAEQLNDAHTLRFVAMSADWLFQNHLREICKWPLDVARPFSAEWDAVIALWSNHDVEWLWPACDPKYDEIIRILEEEMNDTECQLDPEVRSKLAWYFDWENDIVGAPAV